MNLLGLHELITYNFPQVKSVDSRDCTKVAYVVPKGKYSRSFDIEINDHKFIFRTRVQKEVIRIELNSSFDIVSVVELYLKMNWYQK